MSRLIVVAPLSALSKRTRLYKLVSFLHSKNTDDITHVCWERKSGESIEEYLSFDVKKIILIKESKFRIRFNVKLLYMIWFVRVFLQGFKFKKHDLVWALGFESAFPLLLSSKLIGYSLVFDDADRFSMLMNFPRYIKKILCFFEKITSRNVDLHVIPTLERYDFSSSKFFVIKNTPSEKELILAASIFEKSGYKKEKLSININGWLGDGRGMSVALKLATALKNHPVKFILSGRLDCPDAELLSKLDNVDYFGSISNAEALATYFMTDFVFTYYDPSKEINLFAESNKWGDAVNLNNIIIVNNEVVTARSLINSGATVSHSYCDVDSLIKSIVFFLSNPDELEKMKAGLNNLSAYKCFFESRIESLIFILNKKRNIV